jgi:hypothetical protein
MVAFGVLEHEHVPLQTRGLTDDYVERDNKTREIEELVVVEAISLGWKLAQKTLHYGSGLKGRYILLGPVTGSKALPGRVKIGEGTLKEVCIAAVRWMDEGDVLPEPPKIHHYPD